jgi:hypothetical protein
LIQEVNPGVVLGSGLGSKSIGQQAEEDQLLQLYEVPKATIEATKKALLSETLN